MPLILYSLHESIHRMWAGSGYIIKLYIGYRSNLCRITADLKHFVAAISHYQWDDAFSSNIRKGFESGSQDSRITDRSSFREIYESTQLNLRLNKVSTHHNSWRNT